MKIIINNHPGGIIQQTDKPIVNVFGDIEKRDKANHASSEEPYDEYEEVVTEPLLKEHKDSQKSLTDKIVYFFTNGILKVDEPSQLYFLLLAMWARHMLESKEITSFVRMVGETYPALFNEERTQEKVIMSLQNMNGKADKYFDEFVKDQSSMIDYIDLMYPKKKNGKRRKECERAVNQANKMFIELK